MRILSFNLCPHKVLVHVLHCLKWIQVVILLCKTFLGTQNKEFQQAQKTWIFWWLSWEQWVFFWLRSLKLTAKPPKIKGWKMKCPVGPGLLSGAFAVCFGEGIHVKLKNHPTLGWQQTIARRCASDSPPVMVASPESHVLHPWAFE